jgi:hypothetical protein
MHSNVMLRFMVQAFQDPPLCSSTHNEPNDCMDRWLPTWKFCKTFTYQTWRLLLFPNLYFFLFVWKVQYMCKTEVFSPALELTALHISILILNINYPGDREVAISISEILNFQLSFFSQSGKGFCFIRKKLSKIKSNFAKWWNIRLQLFN